MPTSQGNTTSKRPDQLKPPGVKRRKKDLASQECETAVNAITFLSLPAALKRKIGDYCHADDLLALVQTCSAMKLDLPVSILSPSFGLIYGLGYYGDLDFPGGNLQDFVHPIKQGEQISMLFYPKDCHSVRLHMKWSISDYPGRIIVVSRSKVENGSKLDKAKQAKKSHSIRDEDGRIGTIVWESPSEPPSARYLALSLLGEDFAALGRRHGYDPDAYDPERDIQEGYDESPPIAEGSFTDQEGYNYGTDNILFCVDPSQDYFLWYQVAVGSESYLRVDEVSAQWLVWDKTSNNSPHRIRQHVYRKCVEWDRQVEQERDDDEELFQLADHLGFSNDYERPALQFLAKLLVLALETVSILDEVPGNDGVATSQTNTLQANGDGITPSVSIIANFLESTEQGIWAKLNGRLLAALKRVAMIYLQLVERKEPRLSSSSATLPGDFHVDPLSHGAAPPSDHRHLVTLPPILLLVELDDNQTRATPHFVTRIPLTPETKSFRLTGVWGGMHNASAGLSLIIFAKMPQTPLDAATGAVRSNREHWTDGDLILDDGCRLTMVKRIVDIGDLIDSSCDVIPAAEAYYLYVVTSSLLRATINYVELHLSVLDDKEESNLRVMQRFLGRLNAQSRKVRSESPFHLGLLLAVASTLRQCQEQGTAPDASYNVLNNLLATEGFLTDEQSLACLIEFLESLLEYRKSKIPVLGEADNVAITAM